MGKQKEEDSILDTIGDAVGAAGKFLFDRGLSKEGLEEKAKQVPKKVKKTSTTKPTKTTKPKNANAKKQISASPSGAGFFDMTESDLRKQRIADRIARIKQLQEENK